MALPCHFFASIYQTGRNEIFYWMGYSPIWDGYPKLSRRLARSYLAIALFQPPLSERSVTVSLSLPSPMVNPAAQSRQVNPTPTVSPPLPRPPPPLLPRPPPP